MTVWIAVGSSLAHFCHSLTMLKRNSEHFLRKQSACLCETPHPENAFHGQRDSWHERLDETICEGGVRPYCWFSSVSSPFPGPVVPTHLLCKFNLDCERPAEGSSGLLWVSQSAARCRHAGLGGDWGDGLAALCLPAKNVLCALSQGPKCLTHHGCDQKGQPRSQYYHSCRKHVRRYLRVWKRSCSFCLWCFDAGMDPWAGPQPSLVYLGQAQSRKGWRIWPLTKETLGSPDGS